MPMVTDKGYREVLGRRLKLIRVDRKLSQKEVAYRAGLGANQVHLMEKGKLNFTINNLKKLSDALDVSLSEVFKDL